MPGSQDCAVTEAGGHPPGGRGSTATIVPGGRAAGGEAGAEASCPSQAPADSQLPSPSLRRPRRLSLAPWPLSTWGCPLGADVPCPSGLHALSCPLALIDAPSISPGPSQASLCVSVTFPKFPSSAVLCVPRWRALPPLPLPFGHTPSCLLEPTPAPLGLCIPLAVSLPVGPPLTSVPGRGTARPRRARSGPLLPLLRAGRLGHAAAWPPGHERAAPGWVISGMRSQPSLA